MEANGPPDAAATPPGAAPSLSLVSSLTNKGETPGAQPGQQLEMAQPAAAALPAAAKSELASVVDSAGASPPASMVMGAAATPGSSGKKSQQQKTPFQKEALEAAFALSQYPTEDMKRQLGESIGLTAQQVGTWFTHRRRKEKDMEIAELAAAQLKLEQEAAAGAAQGGGSGAAPAPAQGTATAPAPTPAPAAAVAATPGEADVPAPAAVPALANAAPVAGEGTAAAAPPAAAAPNGSAGADGVVASAPALAAVAAQPTPAAAEEAPAVAAAPVPQPPAAQQADAVQAPVPAPAAQAAVPAGAAAPAPPAAAAAATAPAATAAAPAAAAAGEEEPLDEGEKARLAEYEELIEAAKQQLDFPFRDDGPSLGYEFDEIPLRPPAGGGGGPGPGMSTGSSGGGRKRKVTAGMGGGDDEEDPDFVLGSKRPRASKDWESVQAREAQRAALLADRARVQQERLQAQIRKEQEKLMREKDKADARVAKERERELARLEGERRKHLERVMKEQKKEEERRLKEADRLRAMHEKEQRKLQAMQEKEKERQEKMKQREEKKREKEMLRALQQQEKQAMRLRQREAAVTGPKDDADLEWDSLITAFRAHNGLPADMPLEEGGEAPPGCPPLPHRQQFPPASVALVPALPPQLTPEQGSALLTSWAVLHAFGGMLGLRGCTADELLAALAEGSSSSLLADAHITLLRLLQADMEEAHAMQFGPYATTTAAQAAEQRGDSRFLSAAHMLEEAWSWGFDLDAWRAHLNALTWPEVARQLATTAGLGRRRPKPRKEEKPKLGQEGEDTVQDESGNLTLRLPSRLNVGTVKAAAWQVLAEAGPEGMRVEDIAREIQKRGFRDLRSSKTPEASVAGALGRDVLFVRVKAATYALQAIIAHHSQQRRTSAAGQEGGEQGAATGGEGKTAGEVKAEGTDAAEPLSPGGSRVVVVKAEEGQDRQQEHQGSDDEEEEDEEKMDEEAQRRQQQGEPWLEALLHTDYDGLSLEDRISMLCALCHLAIDSPSIRETLEKRMEEQQRIKKQAWEEARAEKRKRQVEAAAKAQAAAEEAHRALQRFQQQQEQRQQQQQHCATEAVAAATGSAAPPSGGGAAATSAAPAGPAPMEVDGASPPEAAAQPAAAAAASPAARAAAAAEGAAQPSASPAPLPAAGAGATPAAAPGSASAAAGPSPGGEPRAGSADAAAASKDGGAADDKEAEAERQRQRAEQVRREMEANSARVEPLGMDRRYNKYWLLPGGTSGTEGQQQGGAKEDGGEGRRGGGAGDRLLFESAEDGSLSVVATSAALGALMSALERRGARESGLYASLLRYREQLEAGLPAGPLALPSPAAEGEQQQQQESEEQQSAWRDVLLSLSLAAPPLQPRKLPDRSSKKAKESAAAEAAAEAAGAADLAPFRAGDSLAVTRIKLDMLRCQRGLPAGAVAKTLHPATWQQAVRDADSAAALRSLLGELEAAVETNHLHPLFLRQPPLVRGAWLPTAHELADAVTRAELPESPTAAAAAAGAASHDVSPGAAGGEAATEGAEKKEDEAEEEQEEEGEPQEEPLAWLPATLASLALRLQSLDASLQYSADGPARQQLQGYQFIQRPSAHGVVSGQPLGLAGRIKQTLFPPLPQRLLYGPRADFSFPKTQFEVDVASGSDALVVASTMGGRGRGTPAASMAAAGSAALGPLGGTGKKGGKRGGIKKGHITEKSALAKEWEKEGSDSEKHYGTDFEEEGGDEFASPLPAAGMSVEPVSGPASTVGDYDDDEPVSELGAGSGDEALSSDEGED